MEHAEVIESPRDFLPHQRIEIRNLVHFVKLVDHTSISGAAEALGLAQPSLSSSIMKLEQMLGAQLLLRSAKGVEFTAAGIALAQRARKLIAELDDITHTIRNINQATEAIRIALVPALAQIITVPLAETAEVEHRKVLLQVSQGMSAQIQRMIEEDYADIGCVYEVRNPNGFVTTPLLTEELFLITAPDNWAGELDESGFKFPPTNLQQLADLPLVMPSNMHGGRSSIIERILERNGIKPNIVIQIDALSQIIEMIERASAYSILPQAAVQPQLMAGKLALVPIDGHKIMRTAYLIRKKGKPINDNTLSMLRMITKVTQEVCNRLDLAVTLHPNTLSGDS